MLLTIRFLLTAGIGAVGSYLFKKYKLMPAAVMIGALCLVAAFHVGTNAAFFPREIKLVTQCLTGAFLGMRIHRSDIWALRKMIPSILLILVYFAVATLLMGVLFHKISGIDYYTAFYAASPGGISDMGIIAESVGADAAMVTLLQLTRLVVVFLYYPNLFHYFRKKGIIGPHSTPSQAASGNLREKSKKEKQLGLLLVLGIAILAAFVGYHSQIPAGALVLPMISVTALNLVSDRAYFPTRIRLVTQCLSGIYLGSIITRGSLQQVPQYFSLVLLQVLFIMTVPLAVGYLLHKITGMDLATAFFSCTPGGMTETVLLADDMNMDIARISVAHLVRLTAVVSVFPYLIVAATKFLA